MNKNYFDNFELGARKKIREFNETANIFDTITDYPRNHYCDFSGTCKQLNLNIEVKDRNLTLMEDGKLSGATKNGSFYADDLYIEDHKYSDLLLDFYTYGLEPIYLNFLNDGYVAIFNLSKLTQRPKRYTKIIRSKGYEKMEFANRQGLSLKDACIYKDGKLIKKRGEKWQK